MIRPLHRLIAFCLTLAWGAATLCCALEAAGWKSVCSVECCLDSDSDHAKPTEGCHVIEDGAYHSPAPEIKITPPDGGLGEGFFFIRHCRSELETERRISVSEVARTRDWVPIWQFERRAAAPARAPDWLNG